MKTWIITRHGSNAANQSMTQSMILGTVEAEDSYDAKKLAGEKWTCYNSQHFSAEDTEDASDADCNEAMEQDALNVV